MSRDFRRSCWIFVAALIALTTCKRNEPAAKIVSLTGGGGEVLRRGDTESHNAERGASLFPGDLVSSSDDGRIELAFAGDNRLSLEPNTTVEIRDGGAAGAGIGAIVIEGQLRATSRGNGVLLQIGTPFGRAIEIGQGETVVEVNTSSGLSVLVGMVAIVDSEGGESQLTAGNMLTIDGLIVPIGGAEPEERIVEVDPIEVVLLSNPRQTRIQRGESEEWERPKKRDRLNNGDAVRSGKDRGARLQFGDGSSVALEAGSNFALQESQRLESKTESAYDLNSGGARVEIPRADVPVAHKVRLPSTELTLEAGAERGTFDVKVTANGELDLAVSAGKARLGDGSVIEAGQSVRVDSGGKASAPSSVEDTKVGLQPASSAIIYFNDRLPAVKFSWDGTAEAAPYAFELSQDKSFASQTQRFSVSNPAFSTKEVVPGRYYWRVKVGSEWKQGTFALTKERSASCANCKRNNTISDTGDKTVVYFQQALPSITLRWTAMSGAASYEIKLFRDGHFDTPLINENTKDTQARFAAGRLKEGKYFWLVNALDASGKEIRAGRTNGLEIAYDNAVVGLKIASPSQNTRVRSSSIATFGEVPLGSRLSINGNSTRIDSKGRFRATVELDRGKNEIVYQTLSRDGVARYHIRDVYRR